MIDFFILGSARSGTTLLRTLLSGHSRICVAPETYFTVPLLKNQNRLTTADVWRIVCTSGSWSEWSTPLTDLEAAWRSHQPRTVPEAIGATFQAYLLATGKSIVGDKTPYHCQHVDLLAREFPTAVFVVIERDGRDVARSLARTDFGSRSFLVNASRWSRDMMAVDRARRRQPERFVTVRYEELVRDTSVTLTKICTFLQVPFEQQMLDNRATAAPILESMRYSAHLQRVAEPMSAGPSRRLSRVRQAQYRAVAGAGARVLGEPMTPSPWPARVVAASIDGADACGRLARRARARAGAAVGRRDVDRFPPTETLMPSVTRPEEVTALVLTHGAPNALKRCLAALANQSAPPARVIVLDNNGEPPARISSSRLDVEVYRSSVNTGPAGGWADLLCLGAESGAGWLWLLDDDTSPERDALQALRHCAESADARAVMPTILEERAHRLRRFPAWIGPLIDASIIDKVGLPRREVVWWAEDSEYLQTRLTQCGFGLSYCDDAVVRHSMTRRSGPVPLWRLYYEARNSIWVRVRVRQQYASARHMRRLARVLAMLAGRAVRHPRPVAASLAVLAGTLHGVTAPDIAAPRFVVGSDGPRLPQQHEVRLVARASA